MTDTLDVALNRTGLHSLEVQERFEASGPFAVELKNHGEAMHVHLNLDDSLSDVARIEATNHYIEADERRAITIETRDPAEWPRDTVRGKLKVVAAHGQQTHWVDVILDRTPEKEPVQVDPELAHPQRNDSSSEGSTVLEAVPVGVLGAIALILALGALFAADGINFVLGGFSLVAGVACAVAAYYLLG